MTISVIIPCYNEEKVIKILYKRLDNVSKIIKDYQCEFVFINDGSIDKTEEIIEELSKNDKRIKLYSFSRNFGHQAAVSCGLLNSNGDIAVVIDADLQDPPEVIPDMIEKYRHSKSNIIYGHRISREGESIFKKVTAFIFYRLINFVSDIKFPIDTGDFRLIDRQVIESYKQFREKPKYIRGIISWMGFKQEALDYNRDSREAGKTKYTLKKMLTLASDGILSFSIKPLRLALLFGILAIIVGILLSIYVFLIYIFYPDSIIKGWASVMITIIFMGGIQLLSLAVICEYLVNIFNQIKNRPEYIVRKKID